MRIGIFGGCFNPPHKMHHRIARELLEKDYVDKVIYVPTGNAYEKKDLIEDMDRYQMLKEMTKEDPSIEVSTYEFGKRKYTYETLQYFQEQYPESTIYFICGTDNLKELDTWKNYLEILNKYKLLIIRRKEDGLTPWMMKYSKYLENILLTDVQMEDLSSTMIRTLFQESTHPEELHKVLDKNVIQYIQTHGLYGR